MSPMIAARRPGLRKQSAEWTPLNLPDIARFWHGDDLGANGTSITTWVDRVAAGTGDITQGTAAQKPTVFVTNGKKTADFDSVDDNLNGTLTGLGAPLTIFVLTYHDDQPAAGFEYVMLLGDGVSAAGRNAAIARYNDGRYYNYDGANTQIGTANAGGAWAGIIATHGTSAVRHAAYRDNATLAPTDEPNTFAPTTTAIKLGNGPAPFDGKVRCAGIVKRVIDSTERGLLTTYLNAQKP